MIQAQDVIASGPAWVVAIAAAATLAAGAFKLGLSAWRGPAPKPAGNDGNGGSWNNHPQTEFRVDVRARLDQLGKLAERQVVTGERIATLLERVDNRLRTHDDRVKGAGDKMNEAARQIGEIHKQFLRE